MQIIINCSVIKSEFVQIVINNGKEQEIIVYITKNMLQIAA